MASLVLNGNTSGSVTIISPAVSGTTTLTLPTTNGTIITTGSTFGGTGPAFSAYQSTLQSVANGVATKVQFQTEDFDTNSNFDNSTNYRFTPTVAGYYQINGLVQLVSTTASCLSVLYKNGSQYALGGVGSFSSGAINTTSLFSCLVYLNGSTDYVELYILQASGGSLNTGITVTRFNGSLVRSA